MDWDWIELGACLLALLFGPLAYQVSRARTKVYSFFDGLVLVGVGSLVLFEILPEQFRVLGAGAIPAAIFGFFFPHLIENRFGSLPVSPRTILSTLILAGLSIHQLLDGAALHSAQGTGESTHLVSHLGAAVILHQVPKGFLLWELARKAGGLAIAVLVIGGLLVSTVLGYFLGNEVLGLFAGNIVFWFQAFIAGGLLHVVVHHVPGGVEGEPRGPLAFWSGIGALVAFGVLIGLPRGGFLEAMTASAADFRTTFLSLALESAVPILAGLLAAGMLQAFIPAGPLRWFHGSNRLSQAARGIVLGLPLPICSCGVTPVYYTLMRRGVPPAAAIAFLIATPEIGFDSFFLSLRFLGLEITLLRLGMAFVIAALTAFLVSPLFSRLRADVKLPQEDLEEPSRGRGLAAKLKRAFVSGLFDLVDQIGPWLVAGLFLAALAEPYLQAEWFAAMPPAVEIVVLALVGLPIYVCASGATPLAAVLLGKGVSAGAVLAFLITGPTTNVTTFGVLSRLHGFRRALALPAVVFSLAVGLAFAINALGPEVRDTMVKEIAHAPHDRFEIACALLLAILVGLSVLRLGPREFLARLGVEKEAEEPHRHERPGSAP